MNAHEMCSGKYGKLNSDQKNVACKVLTWSCADHTTAVKLITNNHYYDDTAYRSKVNNLTQHWSGHHSLMLKSQGADWQLQESRRLFLYIYIFYISLVIEELMENIQTRLFSKPNIWVPKCPFYMNKFTWHKRFKYCILVLLLRLLQCVAERALANHV